MASVHLCVRELAARVGVWLLAGLAICAIGWTLPSVSAAAWVQPVAAPLNFDAAQDAQHPVIADVGGVPYAAWEEPSATGGQIRVARFAAGVWSAVGGVLNIDPARGATQPSITDVGGFPYVAWNEPNSSWISQVWVKRWTGSTWSLVGTGPLNYSATQSAGWATITNVGGTPYVAWEEGSATSLATEIRVAKSTSSGWSAVGGPLNIDPTQIAQYPTIAEVGGVPYVAWSEPTSGSYMEQLRVAKLTGSSWTEVGGALNVNPAQDGSLPSVADVGGAPYVAWVESTGAGGSQIHVARYGAGACGLVGGPLNNPQLGTGIGLSMTSVEGVPYVTWPQMSGNVPQVWVARYLSGSWSTVGGALNIDPARSAYYPAITSVAGDPYVVWQEPLASNGHLEIRAARLQWTLEVTRNGWGAGSVASSPAGINCGSGCSQSYPNGTAVTLNAIPSNGSQFAGWTGGGCQGTGPCVVTVSDDQIITATFTTQHALTVIRAGYGAGSVLSSPAGINCGSNCSHAFDAGTSVTLTAIPAVGSWFGGWSGGCTGAGACKVTMSSDHAITARFYVQPVISHLTLVPLKFALTGHLVNGHCVAATAANRGRPRCTRAIVLHITYRLTKAGRVTFTLERAAPGRAVKGRCVPFRTGNRAGRHCTRLVALPGRIIRAGRAGTNHDTFAGVIGGHTLTPGIYRLTLTASTHGAARPGRAIVFSILP